MGGTTSAEGPGTGEGAVSLTPRMRATLARAREIAAQRGDAAVGTEHVLLAFLDDRDGIAGGTILRLGYEAAIRDEVVRIMESVGYRKPSRRIRRA